MCKNNIRRGILNEFTTLGLVVIATLGISALIVKLIKKCIFVYMHM